MKPKRRASDRKEANGRDAALERLTRRSHLVVVASDIAYKLAKKNGVVSSPDVWAQLWKLAENDAGLRSELEDADPRWMGAVFNRSKWRRIRWEGRGSHKRPVSVWELQPELF